MKEGLLEGIEACLRCEVRRPGPGVDAGVREIPDREMLRKVLERIKTAASPDDLRRVWTRKRRAKTAKPE